MKTAEVKMTPTQAQVLAVLSKSKRPVKRTELQYAVFGTTRSRNKDRAIQRVIRELRFLGYVIVSHSNTAGYRLALTQDEVNHYIFEQLKRAKEVRLTAMRVKKAFSMRNQMALKV